MDNREQAKLESEHIEGLYANHYRVGHNALEFIIEFGQHYEGNKNPLYHTRIILNPIYAKRLSEILAESIEKYESTIRQIGVDDA